VEAGAAVSEAKELEAHVRECADCRQEHHRTRRLTEALARLPGDASVGAHLEAATMRQVHGVLDTQRRRRPWTQLARWLPAPALATLAATLMVVWWRPSAPEVPSLGIDGSIARLESPTQVPPEPPVTPTDANPAVRRDHAEPPAELAAALEMFLEMPILENMEKLQNYEIIKTTDLGEALGAGDTTG